MISVEINTAIKSKFMTLGSPYNTVSFLPLSAYENTSVPFIIYTEFQGTQSEEQHFLKVANIIYTIYDTDISRMKDISWQLEKFLNVGSDVDEIKSLLNNPYYSYAGPTPYRYRLTTARKVAGSLRPPIERDGFASDMLNFRIVYLDNQ